MNVTTNNRVFYGAFISCIIFHLFLIWIIRLYPFQDLCWHLAAATIVKYISEPGSQFAEYFYVDTSIQPNIFHLVFTSMDIFPTVEIGNKWFLTLYIILLPISTLLLIKHFKGNQWFSLLSFIYLYNYNVRWGFVGFIMAIPVLQFLLYFIFKLTSRNSI